MKHNNLSSKTIMYLIDIYDSTYTIENSETFDFIFHSFNKLRNMNSSIPVQDTDGNKQLIMAKRINKVYLINNKEINIKIFEN